MNIAVLSILLAISILGTSLPWTHDLFQSLGARPNAPLIVCIWAAVRLPPWAAIALPLTAGLFIDLLSSGPAGIYTFLFLVTCLPLFGLRGLLDFTALPIFLLAVLAATLLKCGLETVLASQVLGPKQALAFARSAAIIEVVSTTVFALPVFALFRLRGFFP